MGKLFNEFPTIETDRLHLRKLSLADVDDLFAYASDDRLTKYLFWETHRSKADSERFISYALHQYDNKGTAPWGIEDTFLGGEFFEKNITFIDFYNISFSSLSFIDSKYE